MQENKEQLNEQELKREERRDNIIGVILVVLGIISIYGLFVRPFI